MSALELLSPDLAHAARESLRANRANLDALLDEARRSLQRGRDERALQTLQAAAELGWQLHPGCFRDARLDALALQYVDRLVTPGVPEPRAYADDQVLHVLSQAYGVGGHTRLAQRWILLDRERTHSVVLTHQAHVAVPAWLRDAVTDSGGEFIVFDHPDLLHRAAALRDLCRRKAGVVVLHTHPGDLVPMIGLGREKAPVVLLNHADHLMWVGLAAATTVAQIRPSGHRLSVERRGIDQAGSVSLPIPLAEPPSRRRAARSGLGLAEDAVVLLSIAAAHKYGGPGLDEFGEAHREVLNRHPDVTLLVVGPSREGRWSELELATGGRLRALGIRTDIEDLYSVADIYVDSAPLASLTSLLDAALRGLPVVSLAGPQFGTILSCDDPALDPNETQSRTRDDYVARLSRLIEDPGLRQAQGARLQSDVGDHHLGDGWMRHLEQVYATTTSATVARPYATSRATEFVDVHEAEAVDVIAVQLQGPPPSLASWRLENGAETGRALRCRLLWEAVRSGDVRAVRHALPAWARHVVASLTPRRRRRV